MCPVLAAAAGRPRTWPTALDDPTWDAVVQAETDEALALRARRRHADPAVRAAPTARWSRDRRAQAPRPGEAAELVGHVVALARFPGFAELKRSLRELPQLRALGVAEDEVGVVQDWHGGSRRLKR